jgi:YidC/Oxa1 family membrane protein insertase
MEWIYTGISWILLQWHTVFQAVGFGSWLNTDWDWVLAIVFLVLTLRAILFPVFIKQIKSQRAMQALQPRLTELREKHKGDRQALQQAQMELMRAENANPLMGCLPIVVQIPVFIGLFHTLKHLNPIHVGNLHQETLYGWTAGQFESATHAKLFGAPIAASVQSALRTPATVLAMGSTRSNVLIVAGALVVIMVITTFLTQRQMILKTGWATDPTQLMIQRLMMYGVPIGLIFSGTIFPLGVVIYWVTNNLFSLGQQFYVLRKFPPPVTTNGRPPGKLFENPFKRQPPVAAKAIGSGNSRPVPRPTGKDTKDGKSGKAGVNGKPAVNGTPVAKPTVAAPKVGAKPTAPKKGNAAKRLPG